ncbi:hypothetical protein SEA_SPEEDDEMON_1220 [Gordonia phage SpeedDemon]|nr:hypothetical protein SEA_SPEEDDEMON_1220 [Gordonia phage SpeedDemon]
MSAPTAERVTTTDALATLLIMRLDPLGLRISRPEAEMLAHAIEFDFEVEFKNETFRGAA